MRLRTIAAIVLLCAGAGARAQSVAEEYLFGAANAERTERGLPQLRWDAALVRAAYAHALQMEARATISHQFPGEMELAERGKAAGAKFSRIAENVAEAPSAVRIHDAWMRSPGHRENLLDPLVDSVGISVVRRNGQLYAVQDFGRTVTVLTLDEQENAVARTIQAGAVVEVMGGTDAARRTCTMETGFSGSRQPAFVVRYTAGDLNALPKVLSAKLASGQFRDVLVGACAADGKDAFTSFRIAVMLFP